jgi:hypothetical protein
MRPRALPVAPLVIALGYVVAGAFGGSTTAGGEQADEATGPTTPNLAAACTSPVVEIAYKLTGYVPTFSQANVNCASWQTFISLAWPADPQHAGQPDESAQAASFGDPRQGPSVWETYSTAPSVFLPDGAAPTGFGSNLPAPDECPDGPASVTMVLSEQSKFSDPTHAVTLAGNVAALPEPLLEATGQGLMDQQGTLVHYQRLMNEDEYNYIVDNELYEAQAQLDYATRTGIALPAGTGNTVGETVGAIELKAAWRVLDGLPTDRYKTSQAYLIDADGVCTGPHTVGLVGLHIIHKTSTVGNFVWATFEHVDNAPDVGSDAPAPDAGWSFFDPTCADPCDRPSYSSPPPAGQIPSAPVQVERVSPNPTEIVTVNAAVQDLILSTNADSVWQYYQLIDALWDQGAQGVDPGPGATIPLPFDSLRSSRGQGTAAVVANVVLETYVQNLSCSSCHQSATVAGSNELASDYSFLFSTAQCAPSSGCAQADTARSIYEAPP